MMQMMRALIVEVNSFISGVGLYDLLFALFVLE